MEASDSQEAEEGNEASQAVGRVSRHLDDDGSVCQ